MVDARRQFRVMYRDFLVRLVDLDVLSAGGDLQKLFVQFGALLAAFSFVVAILAIPRNASELPPEKLVLVAWGTQEFLIGTTMAIVGIFAVIAWDSVFPDRRDSLNLGMLPVRTRTIFAAKASAIATGLGISMAAVNSFTGFIYPLGMIPPPGGLLAACRSFGAYWITIIAAGAFVFCALLAMQGIAAQFLPYRLFVRVSSFMQVGAFFLILGLYFLTPGPAELSITAPAHQQLLVWFPSFWFVGLFQILYGQSHPVFEPLANRALWSLSIVVVIAGTTYVLAYLRTIRKMIEQPDVMPSARRRFSAWLGQNVVARLVKKPVERAVILFIARTLARSRQHRAILAAYAGIGLAISLTYSKGLLYGESRLYAPLRQYIGVPRWFEPNAPFMAAGFVMLYFTILGARAVFALPAALKANWIFRITTVHSPRAYFAAVRKALYGIAAAPVWIAAALVYFSIWPPSSVTAHLVVLALIAVILIERSLYEFRKIPFACSYLPGQAELRTKLAAYGILFLFATDVGARIERSALESPSRYIVLLAILITLAVRARKRWAAFAAAPGQRIQFEDLERSEIAPLDLRRDGLWATERYIDAVDPEPEKPLRVRIRSALVTTAKVTVVVLVIGAIYEQYGQWQHRRRFPQIGRSVDIGGRSLNIFCSGDGQPTVIFESGAGGPGYVWTHIQREVARFARACWYDRAGYGWSDAGPWPRDSFAIAKDLHDLLRAASIPPPYVLVGASFGGLTIRVFNGRYPGYVAGMVLVDSSHVDEREPIPRPDEWVPSEGVLHAGSILAQSLRWVGILRVVMDTAAGTPPKGMTEQEALIARSFEPRTLAEHAKELFVQSAKQARSAGGLGDRPVIVLTAGLPPQKGNNPVEARQFLARQKRWIESQRQLARLSTRGKQIVVENSRHCITCDAPEVVIDAVREVVTDARVTTPALAASRHAARQHLRELPPVFPQRVDLVAARPPLNAPAPHLQRAQ